jgi:spore coat protein H
MNPGMKYATIFLFCLLVCPLDLAQPLDLSLDLPGTLDVEETNVFHLQVNDYCESKLLEISDQKLEIPSCKLSYNGIPLKTKSCKTRGKTTLHFKRKSLSISLKSPVVIGGVEIKKLALNNLAMDRNYYRNRLSFLLMQRVGIFPLQNDFAELRVNGHSNGLYLAIQKPEDYIRSFGSPLLVRRDYEEQFIVEDSHGGNTRELMKRLRQIPRLTRKLEGQVLYDTLNSLVHMDHYFQWLAFNYLIKNGDYTDELFLYYREDTRRFDIIPWDYDDIFKQQPHDGFHQRNKILQHRLLYSAEEYMDIVIDRDTCLYLDFLKNFQEVLQVLDPELIRDTFEQVYRELYPYYTDQEIIARSESDLYGLTDLDELKTDLRIQFQATLTQWKSIEVIIDAELRRLSEPAKP